KGTLKKSAFEAVYFGHKLAEQMGVACHAVTVGSISNIDELGKYGAQKVHQIESGSAVDFDGQQFSKAIGSFAQNVGAKVIIMAHSSQGKSLAGRLSIRLDAGLVTAVNQLPDTSNGFHVTKSLFSGKAISTYSIGSEVKVLTLIGNALAPQVVNSAGEIAEAGVSLETSKIKVIETKTVDGIVPLPEAELVVSAGRGMKGPENWGIIDELAATIGATTACSRPVADADWRPHHEHVGQTGVAIRPNLYIAIGISGAIQHLAGVNNSKVIVVINKDPEAPFFKAADYGIVADLFDVVPKLNEAFKKVMAG
ncbi:electron transfer flavoprotein subunit alpha/FixB family protein, partial [Saprospiraceae bacterium]|nr:electron transfer flavoprotein subunit alpha/FixB family protein [Saprospiraceae bacterium]